MLTMDQNDEFKPVNQIARPGKCIFDHFSPEGGHEVSTYQDRMEKSWVFEELRKVRNIRPSFRWGLWGGILDPFSRHAPFLTF